MVGDFCQNTLGQCSWGRLETERERDRQTDREEEEAEEERSEIHTSPAMCDSRMLGFRKIMMKIV